MNNLTSNFNLLSPTGFKITVDSTACANVEFFCVSAPLPGITLAESTVGVRGASMYVPGDKLDFDVLNLRIMADEELNGYREIYNWIRKNHSGPDILRSDIVLHIYGLNKNIRRQIRFKDAFPISIGASEFSIQTSSVDYMSFDVSFRYNSFEFIS